MRRAPVCLVFCVLFLGPLTADGALAQPGVRYGAAAHQGGPARFGLRAHGTGSRHHAAFHGRSRHIPAFRDRGYGFGRYGFHGRAVHGRSFYGRGFYGQGFRPHGYGYGGRHPYGLHGRGFHPYGSQSYLDSWDDGVATLGEPVDAPTYQAPPGVPSIADLPASTGIRSAPAGSPTVYVLGPGKRSLRGGGPKIVTMDRNGADHDADGTGLRIIRLNAPRGR